MDENIFISFQEVFGSPQHGEEKKYSQSSQSDYGSSGNNKFSNCKCMNCEKTTSVNKFASHLEVSHWNLKFSSQVVTLLSSTELYGIR